MARIIFLLVIFALVVVIVVYLVKAIKMNNPKEEKQTPIQKTKERTNYSVADELLKLQNLKEEGIITEKEFEEMKKKLME
ncbi:MAG: SHOCT domain-containing protein [Bacteroidales bacterium]|jgi:septation ring formation regulator EzrA|nr:SHOCT domain-containing protein [Bacteroidales bacterium]MBQ1653951.1 SHOCT domain-containing protein [Bacteroidales bacterium]MBQ1730991.1 SHOCT domain-containing protein [Bacteroidales bacterium]MBQ2076618.1 SHOCT domain-containing protein [Bacteroidales bacterium]MBQ2351583.1 SHOCT domain-containing protein [Bacteroidales bacterium]